MFLPAGRWVQPASRRSSPLTPFRSSLTASTVSGATSEPSPSVMRTSKRKGTPAAALMTSGSVFHQILQNSRLQLRRGRTGTCRSRRRRTGRSRPYRPSVGLHQHDRSRPGIIARPRRAVWRQLEPPGFYRVIDRAAHHHPRKRFFLTRRQSHGKSQGSRPPILPRIGQCLRRQLIDSRRLHRGTQPGRWSEHSGRQRFPLNAHRTVQEPEETASNGFRNRRLYRRRRTTRDRGSLLITLALNRHGPVARKIRINVVNRQRLRFSRGQAKPQASERRGRVPKAWRYRAETVRESAP